MLFKKLFKMIWFSETKFTLTNLQYITNQKPFSSLLFLDTDSLFQQKQQPLVEQRADGSLHFSAFPSELYGQDVHSSTYFCEATNTFGTIRSRDVHVRACK